MNKKLLKFSLILVGFWVAGTLSVAFASITLESNPADVFQQTINNPCVIGDPSCKQPTISVGNDMDYTVFSGAPDIKWNGSFVSPAATASIGYYDVTSPVPSLAVPQFSLTTKNSIFGNNTFVDDSGPYLVGTAIGAVGTIDVIPNVFTIGIDVNYTTNQEQLVGFKTWKSTDFNPATGTGTWTVDAANSWQIGPQLLAQHNGNGYSDALLKGFNLTLGNYVFFEAIYGFEVASNNARTTGSDGDGMEEFFIIPQGAPTVPEPATMLLLGSGLLGLAGFARRRFKK